MTTAPSTIPIPYLTQNRAMKTEWLTLRGRPPVLYRNLIDDFSTLYGHARMLGYNIYLYPGGVMQAQPESYAVGTERFFISFWTSNDAYQHFSEASGAGYVFGRDDMTEFMKSMEFYVTEEGRELSRMGKR